MHPPRTATVADGIRDPALKPLGPGRMGDSMGSAPGESDLPRVNAPRWTRCERAAWSAVVVGLILRVWEYFRFRELYMDEDALLRNLVGVPVFDFHHILKQDQLAPPGFLVVERVIVRLPVSVLASARLFPLACGLASMLLIVPLARRYVTRLAVPIAAGVFALSDHLIYYSAEIKPYACDLVAAMAALLLAAPGAPARPTPRRLAGLAAFGLIAPWFSFPVVFTLAGVGLHLLARRAIARDWRGTVVAILIGVAWLASFGGCFALSRAIMSKRDFLWVWWGFAFLPIPPGGWADARFVAETLANVFINPGSVLTPFGLPVTAILACAVAILGCISLGRRWAGGLFLLLAPLIFTLAGSALRQYPFHGRLILGLVPTYHLLLVEGIASIGRQTRRWAAIALASVFLVGQASEVFQSFVILQNNRSHPYDSHGDLKNDLLDYLDSQRRQPRTRVAPKASNSPARDVGTSSEK
jgi:hypothetical protein